MPKVTPTKSTPQHKGFDKEKAYTKAEALMPDPEALYPVLDILKALGLSTGFTREKLVDGLHFITDAQNRRCLQGKEFLPYVNGMIKRARGKTGKKWLPAVRTITPKQMVAKARRMLYYPTGLYSVSSTCNALQINQGGMWQRIKSTKTPSEKINNRVCLKGTDFLPLIIKTAEAIERMSKWGKKPAPPPTSANKTPPKESVGTLLTQGHLGVVALLKEASLRQGELKPRDLQQIAKRAGVPVDTVKDIERVLSRSLVTRLIEQLARGDNQNNRIIAQNDKIITQNDKSITQNAELIEVMKAFTLTNKVTPAVSHESGDEPHGVLTSGQ